MRRAGTLVDDSLNIAMLFLVYLAVFVALPSFAATGWTEIKSPNFQLITTAGPAEARRAFEYFEQLRDFFMRTRSSQATARGPVTVVLFRNMKEFRPYSPNAVANAWYTGDQSHDYIVISGEALDDRPVATHEYMHLLVRNMDLKLPPWLNEGLADVYSTLDASAGRISIGAVPQGRASALLFDKWIPLERVLAVQHDSPEYNEKSRVSAFYAQSWMLVHMLMLSDYYRPNFDKFLAAVSGGAGSEAAFQQIYSRTVTDVSKDLKAYYRANNLKAAVFEVTLQRFEGFEPHPADAFTVELTLSRISALLGRKEDATLRLERLAGQFPDRWEVYEALGTVALRNGDLPRARESLRRAVDLHPSSWNVYWDYARVAQSDPAQQGAVIAALRRSLELNGNNNDARLALGYELFQAGNYQEALDTYNAIRSVTPDKAALLFLGQAHAAARLQRFEEAKTAALNAKKNAREARDLDSANQLLDYLNRRGRGENQ